VSCPAWSLTAWRSAAPVDPFCPKSFPGSLHPSAACYQLVFSGILPFLGPMSTILSPSVKDFLLIPFRRFCGENCVRVGILRRLKRKTIGSSTKKNDKSL
jgi:hypothetical protein